MVMDVIEIYALLRLLYLLMRDLNNGCSYTFLKHFPSPIRSYSIISYKSQKNKRYYGRKCNVFNKNCNSKGDFIML